MNRTQWIARYAAAWRDQDPVGVVSLFTDDAVYHASPTGPRHIGSTAIAAYWKQATSEQPRLTLRFGLPVSEGPRTLVEWWATMQAPAVGAADPEWITRPGCLVLRVNRDGLCEELWQYAATDVDARIDASPGWGV